jgi:hypothetical protein
VSAVSLLFHPLEAERLAYSSMSGNVQGLLLEVGAIYGSITLACLNHAASADSSFSNGERFSDLRCLEKGRHGT